MQKSFIQTSKFQRIECEKGEYWPLGRAWHSGELIGSNFQVILDLKSTKEILFITMGDY